MREANNTKKKEDLCAELAHGPSADPQRSRGKRNLYCVAYDTCLDTAIQNNWPTFSCSRSCTYIQSYDPPDILTDNPDHWELYDFYLW
jgi:hypothetical protein